MSLRSFANEAARAQWPADIARLPEAHPHGKQKWGKDMFDGHAHREHIAKCTIGSEPEALRSGQRLDLGDLRTPLDTNAPFHRL